VIIERMKKMKRQKLLSESLKKFRDKYPASTSADLQTYIIAFKDAIEIFKSLLPSDEKIEESYPSKMGEYVIMEDDMSYNDVIYANRYRKQGAKDLKQQILNKLK
jgi:hypothetical protein